MFAHFKWSKPEDESCGLFATSGDDDIGTSFKVMLAMAAVHCTRSLLVPFESLGHFTFTGHFSIRMHFILYFSSSKVENRPHLSSLQLARCLFSLAVSFLNSYTWCSAISSLLRPQLFFFSFLSVFFSSTRSRISRQNSHSKITFVVGFSAHDSLAKFCNRGKKVFFKQAHTYNSAVLC